MTLGDCPYRRRYSAMTFLSLLVAELDSSIGRPVRLFPCELQVVGLAMTSTRSVHLVHNDHRGNRPCQWPSAASFPPVKRIRLPLFLGCWLFVICVSVHDGLLVLANRGLMAAVERNPVGRVLIAWNDGDIWLLLMAKALGTVSVASLLLLLYWSRWQLGFVICSALAAFQFGLLLYLQFA